MAADENATPRRGRHSAARHAAPPRERVETVMPEIEQTAEASAPVRPSDDVLTSVAPLDTVDQELQMGDAPAPIGVDPGETGSFSRLAPNEGARVTTRVNASETASFRAQNSRPMEAVRMSTSGRPHVERHETEVKSNARVFAILGVAAVLVVALMGWLLARALVSVEEPTEEQVFEQAQSVDDEGIEYRGTTYKLAEQKSGKYALVSTTEGQESEAVVCELDGKPVTIILYNTVFVVPQNLSDGTWDLIAHPLGGGGVTQPVIDSDGKPIVGKGEIARATLQGDAVQVETTSGEITTVPLK